MTQERPPADDTIVAISTPAGRGGVGVVRLSGPRAAEIAGRLFRPNRHGEVLPGPSGGDRGDAGRLVFGRLVSPDGEPIDQGYLAVFHPPRTYTGEEVAELWAHGSPVVLRFLVEAAARIGARPATPGEFTLRAFLNGRVDATRAEAIRDLIEARTAFQAKVAHDQVMGRIAVAVDGLKDRLAELVARVEAAIEFSEEAEAARFAPDGGLGAAARALRIEIEVLAGTYDRGRRVRDGAAVAIVGSPNVGKSSLFNRLLEEERAIVTPLAGTTRDLLEETLDLGGLAVILTDTAGIHEPHDEADAEAVRRARAALDTADLLLVVLDWSRPLGDDGRAVLRGSDRERAVVVFNKGDLPRGVSMDEALYVRKRYRAFEVSAKTGEGIDDLRRRLGEAVGAPAVSSRETTFLTNVRHRDLLLRAAGALARSESAARIGAGEEYLVIDLKEALDRLGEITGEVGAEGIYERIFRNFCIGK